MSTVASRTFRSNPQRDALQTWNAVVDLLTRGNSCANRTELLSVGGVAASVIAEQGPKGAPIVVTCDGPCTRIYCLYDEEAIDGSDANEDELGFDPLNGDWRLSLPCPEDDLAWVQAALKKQSSHITARDLDTNVSVDDSVTTAKSESLVLDPKGFLGS